MRKGFAAARVSWSIVALWIGAVSILALSGPVSAQELYGCDSSGRLFVVDVLTGMGTHVCDLPVHPDPGATELEYDDLTFRAFVQARDGIFSGQLVDIFSCVPLGGLVPTDDFAFNGLEFVDGVLYGTGIPYSLQPSELMIIDPETGATDKIGPTGLGPVSGLAWDASSAKMYGITGGWQAYGPSKLVTIDLASGAATIVGDTGIIAGSIEIGPDGLLYAAGSREDGGNLYRIDPATGNATLVGPTGFASVTGLTLVTRRAITLSLDIKPGACPNPLNVRPCDEGSDHEMYVKAGVLPVAILGTESFDVRDIDPTTVLLEGIAPLRQKLEDVAAPPFAGRACECTTAGPDGYMDLTLKFERCQIVSVLRPGLKDDMAELTITGELFDGTPFEATDCVEILGRELGPPLPPLSGDDKVRLDPAVPNPFNPTTRLTYGLDEDGFVRLSVYDSAGKLVTRLASGHQSKGEHWIEWDAGQLPSGVYFCAVELNGVRTTQKIVLLK